MSTSKICPANRVDNIKEYYFSRKLREIANLNAAGADIISLGIGGPDRPPIASAIETLQRESLVPSNHSYQSYVGIPELRDAMAHWYEHYYNVKLSPNNEIQPLIGSKEGILMISLAFLNPGDGVLVPNPGYPTYSSVSYISGAEVYNYNLNESNGWMPNFDELESMPTEKIKLMWVNYPHMPTGTPANLQLFEKLVSFGKRHNIIIVNDNPYSFILNDKPLSILQVDGAKDIAIELNSLSKSHNMAGWRIGMMASNSQFISWILKIQSNIESGQFRPMMLAAAEALKCDDSWYKELNTVYSERRIIAEKIMESLGCYFDPSQRGLFLWGRIPNNYLSSEDLADKVLSEARVFITPGFIFGSNGDRYVRISLCAKSEKMEEALARINNCKSFR